MTRVAGVFLVGSFLVSAGGPADKVDTRIGTETGRGSCMVGPCVPHGSVYPSPDTIWPSAGRKFPAPSGYYPGDKVVGFSQLHAQGTGGTPSYGLFRVIWGEPSALEIREAHPYRFRGCLIDMGIEVSVSATAHGAIYEYSSGDPRIDWFCKIGDGKVSTNATARITGNVIAGGGTYSGNWNPAPYDCWFYATKENGRLRIAISFKDVEQAHSYHDAELAGRTVDDIAADARREWNGKLSSVAVEGLSEGEAREFYTHLFHAFVQPRDRVSDGLGWDDHYTAWDTWKTLFPLMALADPATVSGCVNHFAERFANSGRCDACYTQGKEYQVGQGGDEVDCIIADALIKSVDGIDWKKAVPLLESRWTGRTASYRERGFVSDGEKGGYCWRMMSGSGTMSFAYQDYCVGSVLRRLKGAADPLAKAFVTRSGNWTNVWNDAAQDGASGIHGFACGRNRDGSFMAPDPRQGYNRAFYEARGWEYSFFVPHDMESLISRCGGRAAFVSRLEYALQNKLIDFGNEPSFLTPWLFSFAGRSDLSSRWAHEVRRFFPRDGCPGDDDSGAMGSFFVFLTAGLMPVAGTDLYLLHAPMAEKVVFLLPGTGRTFTVIAPGGAVGNWKYNFVTLNGRRLTEAVIRHSEIMSGGELVFSR